MTDLEKRLQNAENMLVTLAGFVLQMMPPEPAKIANVMMESYFKASETMGAFKQTGFVEADDGDVADA